MCINLQTEKIKTQVLRLVQQYKSKKIHKSRFHPLKMSQPYQATNQFLLKTKPLWYHQEKPNRLPNLHRQSHNKSKGLFKTKLNLKLNKQSNHQNNQIKENNRSNHLNDNKSKDNRQIRPQMIQEPNRFRIHSLTNLPTIDIKTKSKSLQL